MSAKGNWTVCVVLKFSTFFQFLSTMFQRSIDLSMLFLPLCRSKLSLRSSSSLHDATEINTHRREKRLKRRSVELKYFYTSSLSILYDKSLRSLFSLTFCKEKRSEKAKTKNNVIFSLFLQDIKIQNGKDKRRKKTTNTSEPRRTHLPT